jgi:glyoxylase-like metal-dependent hydrolase (beta-lactamase superfamily II)
MTSVSNRRRFLQGALVGAAGLGVLKGGLMPRQALAATALAATPVGDRHLLVSGAGGNVLVAHGGDGVLLVDAGRRETASALLALVKDKTGGKPLGTVFNTHWHLDQTGGNAAMHEAGATIIAHENTRLWMTTDFTTVWDGKHYDRRPKAEHPDKTFFWNSETLEYDGQKVEYGYLMQGHTDGDIYVRFPRENILAVGDLLYPKRYPIIDYSTGGWIGGLIKVNQTVLDLADDKTVIVAGTGGLMARADVEAQVAMLQKVYDQVAETYRAGLGLAEFRAADPLGDFKAQWSGDEALFTEMAFSGTWGHVRELGKII